MKKLIPLAILLLSLACVSQTVGTISAQPTVASTTLPTVTNTIEASPTITATQPANTAYVANGYHVRQEAKASGVTVDFVENEVVTIIGVSANGWYQVETPRGKVGWLSPLAIGE